jgi:hypothetical protein
VGVVEPFDAEVGIERTNADASLMLARIPAIPS